jgi:uncharacterized RDD family membrane protein YckC
MAQVAAPSNQASQPKTARAANGTASAMHQVDNTFRLTTPENIAFQYRLAGPFRRVFPYLLDLLVVSASYAILVLVTSLLFGFMSPMLVRFGLGMVVDFLGAIALAVGIVGWFLIYWFYGAYCETYYNGRTFGKMVAKIRVLSTDGHAIDGVQATLRNFFRAVDLMPMLPVAGLLEIDEIPPSLGLPTALFGLAVMSISPRFQRLGDLVAGTMVVIQETALNPEIQKFEDPRVPKLAAVIPDTFYVSSSLAKSIAEYAQRRERLGVGRAGEIASKLADNLKREFDLPADTDPDLLICSLYYKVFSGANEDDEAPGAMNTLAVQGRLAGK